MDREKLAESVAGTASELRMQLAHITAASQVLERLADGERAHAYLAVVNQSICRMLRIVGRMELMSRLTDEDEIRQFPSPVDLGPWTLELSRRIQGVLQRAHVTLRYEGPKILLANVDEPLVSQMLLELICTVAMPEHEISLTLTQCDDNACFTVRGTALSPDQADWEGDETRRWEIPLARRIAQLHGGSLVEEYAAEGGVTLAATLPMRLHGPSSQLDTPRVAYRPGGFDPVLIALSNLLPSESFLPEELN